MAEKRPREQNPVTFFKYMFRLSHDEGYGFRPHARRVRSATLGKVMRPQIGPAKVNIDVLDSIFVLGGYRHCQLRWQHRLQQSHGRRFRRCGHSRAKADGPGRGISAIKKVGF